MAPSRAKENSDNIGSPGISPRLALGCGRGRRRSFHHPYLWTVRDVIQHDGRRAISLSRTAGAHQRDTPNDNPPAPPRPSPRRLVFVSLLPGRWIRMFSNATG
jgi:hypothetical protein